MPKYFLILLVFLCFAADADIFKWVDDNGKIHYSDKKVTGAEQVELPKAVTYTPTDTGTVASGTAKPQQKDVETSLSIVKPMMNETIHSNSGDVGVQMAMNPGLIPGYTITLYLDGNETLKGLTQGSTTLSGLERGSHTIRASVLNKEGVSLVSSKSVIFHLRKEAAKAKESNDSTKDNGEAFKPNYSKDYKKSYKNDPSHDYDSSGTYEDGAKKYEQGIPSNSGKFNSGGSAYSPNYNQK